MEKEEGRGEAIGTAYSGGAYIMASALGAGTLPKFWGCVLLAVETIQVAGLLKPGRGISSRASNAIWRPETFNLHLK